jgi:hypothetical protein
LKNGAALHPIGRGARVAEARSSRRGWESGRSATFGDPTMLCTDMIKIAVAARASAITLFVAMPLLGVAAPAIAQSAEDLVGVWTSMKTENVSPDGTRTPAFGGAMHSQLILTANRRFSQIFIRADLPKFASGNRLTGTADENAAVVKGSNVAFGVWTLGGDRTVTLSVEASTFPNWTGTRQQRPIKGFTGDELNWIVPAGSGGFTFETV